MKEMEEVKEATDTALRSAEIAEEAHCIVDAELRKWICLQKSLQWPPTITGLEEDYESFTNMLSSVSFSVLSVSVQKIIKRDPLNYKTQISLALFLRTYTQRSSLQPQARSDLTRTRIHQSHKTRMKIVELTRQMSSYMSIRSLVVETTYYDSFSIKRSFNR